MKHSKPPPDPRGGHVRLHWDMLDSSAWNCLTAGDQRAYVALVRALRKTNNGDLSLPLSRARHYQINSPTTLAKSLRALVAVGLLCVTRKGGSKRDGTRECTLYALTDIDVYELPAKHINARKATNDWRQVKSLDHGRALIVAAEANAKDEAVKKKNLHQNLIATHPKTGVVGPKTTPKNDACPLRPVQKMDYAIDAKSSAKPMAARVVAR